MKKQLEIVKIFFKMGCFAFGGPAAHVAMMETEIVSKRKWMSQQDFLDLVGATNLIPGPNSTEMAMHCGYKQGGILGLLLAGASFIIPSTILTGILAWLYVDYGQLPLIAPFIIGIKPIILSVIAGAILKLGKKALKNWEMGILGSIVLIACFFGINEIVALLSAGVVGAIYFSIKESNSNTLASMYPLLGVHLKTTFLSSIPASSVFLTFLKVGAILYGSGYVLFAYLDVELVQTGLLTRAELLDAIAVGQFTPGPVLSTATFIGYQLNGVSGAIASTLGIFLPSFVFAGLLHYLLDKLKKIKALRFFLDSINIAAVAVMISVLITMTRETVVDWKSGLICLVGIALTFYFKKVSTIWVVIIGSILGYLLHLI